MSTYQSLILVHIFQSILKPDAYTIGKSRFFPKKDKKGVRNNNVELNFIGMSNIKMNHPEKSSKIGSYSGLHVNNISNQCSQENVIVVKQELFDPIDSEWKHVRDPFIKQNEQDKVSPKECPDVISPGSSLPIMSLKGRDGSIGRSLKEKETQHVMLTDFPIREEFKRRHYYEGGARIKPHSGSQLQISSEKVFQPVNLPSNPILQTNILRNNPNSLFLQNNHISHNQSLGDIRNVGSNFQEKFIGRINPRGHVFQPSLSNAEMNDRKMGHHDTSSPLRLPLSSPPSTWLPSLTSTHERLLRPISSNSFPPNTWNMNFSTSTSNHPMKAMYPPNSLKNSNVYHVPIVQPTPILNQPSSIKGSHHAFANSRKRRAVEIIDFTNPHKLPYVGANSESNIGEDEIDTSDVPRSRIGVDPNAQVKAFP